MLYRDKNGKLQMDSSADSSMWGLFAFGLYSATDPKIVSTMEDLREKLWVKTDIGGMASTKTTITFASVKLSLEIRGFCAPCGLLII